MAKVGVLLMNVGTPDAATKPAVRRYLQQFLMDKRVVSIPSIMRFLLVHGLILPFRTAQSTKAYQEIWDEHTGSPLLHYSRRFQAQLQETLGSQYHVALGMRYGNPSIEAAMSELKDKGIQKILLAPLYPQYASASTGTALEQALQCVLHQEVIPEICHLGDFYQHPYFIEPFADLIRPYLAPETDAVLLSYHGLPLAQVQRSEAQTPRQCEQEQPCPEMTLSNQSCYRAQCYATSRLLAKSLNLPEAVYTVSFQSRVGMNRWIGPDTVGVLKKLIGQGKRHLVVACPSFVTDCLETLEEIDMRARELWISLGGEGFQLVPCLNDERSWVEGFANIIHEKLNAHSIYPNLLKSKSAKNLAATGA